MNINVCNNALGVTAPWLFSTPGGPGVAEAGGTVCLLALFPEKYEAWRIFYSEAD